MHQLILKFPKYPHIDHKNGDGLDNRKENLRACSASQNLLNRGKTRANTSGYKGVELCKSTNRWRSRIKLEGKRIHLGYFLSKEDAALAYNAFVKEKCGDFAVLNQP